MMRLDHFLSEAGCGSRREVKDMIRRGLVRIGGETEKRPERKVDEAGTDITLEGNPVLLRRRVWYMMNKAAGCVTAAKDSRYPAVLDCFTPQQRKNLFPVGRLDLDTEGLLLFTDDGQMAHRLLSPRYHVEKQYFFISDGRFTPEEIGLFGLGMDIGDDKKTEPAKLTVCGEYPSLPEWRQALPGYFPWGTPGLSGEGPFTAAMLVITEGRYHQVKRMVQAVNKNVLYLKRLSFGPIRLDENLAPGSYRELTPEETALLYGQHGGN